MTAKLSERAIDWIKNESGGRLMYAYEVADVLGVSRRAMAGAWPTVLGRCVGPAEEHAGWSLMYPWLRLPPAARVRGLRYAWVDAARQFMVCYRIGSDDTADRP